MASPALSLARRLIGRHPASKQPEYRDFRQSKIQQYKKRHGRLPDLDNPTRFSEKLLVRILAPVDPIYNAIGYKHIAPFFVRARVGDRLKIPKRLAVVDRLTPALLTQLPNAFVAKSSFGTGLNAIVPDKAAFDWAAACTRFDTELSNLRNAQGLKADRNCIVIEEFLGNGEPPADIKIHCFHTEGDFDYLIQLVTGRSRHEEHSLFDANRQQLPFVWKGRRQHRPPPLLPRSIDTMIGLAHDLSLGFDYLRVDLYDVDGAIYFGELTPFHLAATVSFDNDENDRWIGAKWHQTLPMYRWPNM